MRVIGAAKHMVTILIYAPKFDRNGHEFGYDFLCRSAFLKLEKNILAGSVGEYVFVKLQLLWLLGICLESGYEVWHMRDEYAVHLIQLVSDLFRTKLVNVIPGTKVPVVEIVY